MFTILDSITIIAAGVHGFMHTQGGGGGGGTRGVRHTGVCRSNRSLFWEKSLNIGYGFELENLKHTPHFW